MAEPCNRPVAPLYALRITYDKPTRTVVIVGAGQPPLWHVPGDEPWIVALATGPSGEPVATPLAAWVTYRATRDAAWVRLLRPLEQRSDRRRIARARSHGGGPFRFGGRS